MIEMLNMDCMDYMRDLPDKAFDLAIVDPPYGIEVNHNMGRRRGDKASSYKPIAWDTQPPPREYFEALMRVSKNQIIWGGNYFSLPPTPCWILWDKGLSEDLTFAQFEMAWSSFTSSTKKYSHTSADHSGRIHPTQKPVALYKWLLSRYAKPGDRILDTHGGSGSICIACHDLGFDLTWMELDADYYKAACERYQRHAAQGQLFDPVEVKSVVQYELGR